MNQPELPDFFLLLLVLFATCALASAFFVVRSTVGRARMLAPGEALRRVVRFGPRAWRRSTSAHVHVWTVHAPRRKAPAAWATPRPALLRSAPVLIEHRRRRLG